MIGAKQATVPGTPPMTARQLVGEVRARYPRPEWLCEPEVALAGRRLDVVALNLWSTRAHRIVGFEVKVSRGDWLRELSAFEKSADWHAVVDAFYVVTPGGLVQPDELPGGWGLLELRGTRMFTKVQAVARTPRADLPREVAARFLSRIAAEAEQTIREHNSRAGHELRLEIEADIEARVRREFGNRIEHADEQARDLTALREALGSKTWESTEALRTAVEVARTLGGAGLANTAKIMVSTLERHAGQLSQVAQGLKDLLANATAQVGEATHGQ